MKTVIGVDEVGRGPLAGPVVVSAFRLRTKSTFAKKTKILDSKKLSEKEREEYYSKILEERSKGNVDFATASVGAKVIDRENISRSLRYGIKKALKKINALEEEKILLDGSLYAPKKFIDQETIIKGDEKEKVIALSSIVAKVERDRKMIRLV
ncbi:MAG: ribonuclease HII [Candidatus Campbellbacteria bacterium]|nr:ribonuclease HII [Candidatus Campbellbacteria bacterium]